MHAASILNKLLITGGKGQIAWDLEKLARQNHLTTFALSHHELDITDPDQMTQKLELLQPTLIVNCAGYTAVDKAEEEGVSAYQANRDGPAWLAEHCLDHRIPLIHLSTDYVFDGHQQEPYRETDSPHPISLYGQSKLAGEEAIRRVLPEHIILRVSGVFGFHGNNFVKTMARLVQEKEELRVVFDQITCPTPAEDVAEVILKIIHALPSTSNAWGTYHYCSRPPVSWYDFASTIIELVRRYKPVKTQRILPIPSAEWKSPAARPKNAMLNAEKIQKTFQIYPKPWKISLEKIIQEWLA